MSDIDELVEKMGRKFTSANSVDVERSTITKAEWEILKAHLAYGEPFTWVFTDVNGKAKEIADNPVHRSSQDLRVYTALYKQHPHPITNHLMQDAKDYRESIDDTTTRGNFNVD